MNVSLLKNSEKYILPGVGSFDNAMNSLQDSNVINLLHQEVFNNKTYFRNLYWNANFIK